MTKPKQASMVAAPGRQPPSTGPHYHLRFLIPPVADASARARELAAFCRRHGIEEVELFTGSAEWPSHFMVGDNKLLLAVLKRIKSILGKAGLRVSLNPIETVGHGDYSRRFPANYRFQTMVSPFGETCRAVASFACARWRRQISSLYGRFAELGFRVIWLEDDFRYVNHNPLTWGGGFESVMLARFSDLIGRPVKREEVLKSILKPGKPHPWRALWLKTWRDAQLEAARAIAAAVTAHAPAGGTRLGLMSSSPARHAVEGRDWGQLFDALTIQGRVAHRPNFITGGPWLDYRLMRLDMQRQVRPPSCEVAPEVETYPHTRWQWPDTLVWSEMSMCQFFGSDALLLNLFPMTGNRIRDTHGVGELLDRSRPALAWIATRFTKQWRTRGVGLPWRQDAAEHIRLTTGRSLAELESDPVDTGHQLLAHGIPVTFESSPVNALMGTLAWAFDDTEIRRMLSGGLILDGVSAAILCERGFARYIGLRFRRWDCHRDSSIFPVRETVTTALPGAPRGFIFKILDITERVGIFTIAHDAIEWTTLQTGAGRRLAPGFVVYRNSLGGCVATQTMPQFGQHLFQASDQRQALLQHAIRFMSRGRVGSPLVRGGPYLLPVHFERQGRHWLVICNAGRDPARLQVFWPGFARAQVAAYLLSPLAQPRRVGLTTVRRTRLPSGLESTSMVPFCGFFALSWRDNAVLLA